MFNFFAPADSRHNDRYFISGNDYNHIKNVLRMREGDAFLVSDCCVSHLCRIESIDDNTVVAVITEEKYQNTELPIDIYLFQGLPKSDKMELIIQKTAELGVHSIIPTEMNRCVVKLEEKKKKSKTERWQAISESAAKQSKRSIIPEIQDVMSFSSALKKAQTLDIIMVPYECKNGTKSTLQTLNCIKKGMSVGIFIGPEGGFDEKEIRALEDIGGVTVSLGKRILRTETAAMTAVGMCMMYAEMFTDGDEE